MFLVLHLFSALRTYTTMPYQLQCQHPPPKPPASLSTAMKVPSPIAYNSLCSVGRRWKERGRKEVEKQRNGEVALSGRRVGVRLAARGSSFMTLTLSLCLSFSLLPLLPHVGYLSHCLIAVCQTIPLSPLWGTGWMPSRWAATVTTLSTLDLHPLTWWPRWQQSEWSSSGLKWLTVLSLRVKLKLYNLTFRQLLLFWIN